jgi:tetratricopeptide (TPR) repeat protein
MKTNAQHSTGRLVGIMLIIVVAGILVARSYYRNVNSSVDPRIQRARELYGQYNKYAGSGDYYHIFALLDSISDIYRATPHYKESFELGVLDNNRAAALMTIALYGDSIPESANPYHDIPNDSIVDRAERNIREAIELYEKWNRRFEGKDEEEIRKLIEPEFIIGLDNTDPELSKKYLKNRVKEILESVEENQRRLSVCYTNLGLVYRYRKLYPETVAQYEKAIELWEQNLDAENNLNKLLGRPLKKRNIIQKLFPPERD